MGARRHMHGEGGVRADVDVSPSWIAAGVALTRVAAPLAGYTLGRMGARARVDGLIYGASSGHASSAGAAG